MLKIRLSRVGRKHEPVYRLVVVDSHEAARTSKVVEIVGSYDSRRGEKAEINAERVNYWLSTGAQPSDTAHNLLVNKGIIKGDKRNVLSKTVIESAKKKPVEEAAPAPVVEAPAPVAETVTEETTETVETPVVDIPSVEEVSAA